MLGFSKVADLSLNPISVCMHSLSGRGGGGHWHQELPSKLCPGPLFLNWRVQMFPTWHNRGLWWINSKFYYFRQTSLSANSIKEDQNIFWPKALLAFYHRWGIWKVPGRENKSASECNSFTGEGSNFGLFALPLLTKDQIQLGLSFSLMSALVLTHLLSFVTPRSHSYARTC